MKLPHFVVLIFVAMLLTACDFSLASDITPPPDYVSPTPMPTLGALVPASAPDVQQGAAIFSQNCAACHGTKGLGDGPQSMQLPVTVPGIGLADVARQASPADWFKTVTQGNLDRYMPPFAGALTDAQRWDVVAYVFTLHTTQQQIDEGRQLFQADCASCAGKFSDQARMAALSEDDIVSLVKNGGPGVPAFGKSLTDEQQHAVAAYVRTLTFAAPVQVAAALTPAPVGTPGTPVATPQAGTAVAGAGTITGTIQMGSGGQLPGNLPVTLHGYDHGQDQTTGPQEVLTLSATAAADGTYSFHDVAMPVNRIFLVEVPYAGFKYRSDFAAVQAGTTALSVPTLKLYDKSTDVSLLKMSQVHIYTDFATSGTVQVLEIYAFTNSSDRAVVISEDGNTIPFIKLPADAQNPGYEAGQGSAPLIAANNGLAAPPSDTPYSIIAFFTMPYAGSLDIHQPFALDAPSIVLLVPQGMSVSGSQLTDRGVQVIQNNNYHEYAASSVKAGQELAFSVTGSPSASSGTGLDARQIAMIAGGVLGVAMIIAGVLLFLRDRKRPVVQAAESDFASRDEVMDAILALDDLHRAGKIGDEAYQKRRDDLKGTLRGMA